MATEIPLYREPVETCTDRSDRSRDPLSHPDQSIISIAMLVRLGIWIGRISLIRFGGLREHLLSLCRC